MTTTPEQRRAALERFGISADLLVPSALSASFVGEEAADDTTGARGADQNPYSLPAPEDAAALSPTEWETLFEPHLRHRQADMKVRRAFVGAMLRFIVCGVPWSQLDGRDASTRETMRRLKGKDCWRSIRAAIAVADMPEDRRRQLLRVADYLLTGNPRLLAWRPGIEQYLERVGLPLPTGDSR